MLSALLGLPALLTQFMGGLFGWLNKKQDVAVTENTNAKDVTVAALQNDTAHFAALTQATSLMFNHPVYWVAWGLGVFPVLFYHAAIFFVSTFPVLGWHVAKVPNVELEYARLVVGAVFTLTGTSTVVAGLAHAWIKRA